MRQRTSRATSTFNILDFRFSGVQLLRHGLNDTTNAFKAYRKTCLDGLRPFLSPHFNLTVEIPLKAIIRGYSFAVIPITWRNRRHGIAKLTIREMGSRYLFIVLYLWLEKYLSRDDYAKTRSAGQSFFKLSPSPFLGADFDHHCLRVMRKEKYAMTKKVGVLNEFCQQSKEVS